MSKDTESRYKALYIEMIKKHADNPCEKCANNPHVTCGKECPEFIEGSGGYMVGGPEDGKYVDFPWDCRDWDWGDCTRLENTVCNSCIKNDFANFTLKELDEDA